MQNRGEGLDSKSGRRQRLVGPNPTLSANSSQVDVDPVRIVVMQEDRWNPMQPNLQPRLNKVGALPWGQIYQMGPRSFLASARIDGHRYQRYFKTVALAARYIIDMAEGPVPSAKPAAPAAPAPATGSKTVQEAVAAYLDDIGESLSKPTLANYRQILSRLDGTLAQLTPAKTRAWLKENWEGKASSQQHAIRALSAFWNWCAEEGWCSKDDSPLAGLAGVRRRLRRQQHKARKAVAVWSPEDMEKVYRKAVEADPRIRGWFICAAWLGLRPAEAMRVTRDDLHEDRLLIPPEKAKSSQGRYRTIPFTSPLEAVGQALQAVQWFDGHLVPWTDEKAPTRIVTEAAKAAGVDRGHDVLRHSAATYLSQLVGEETCSRLLGHTVEVERAHYNGRAVRADAERYYGIAL